MFRHALQTYIDNPTQPRVLHHTDDVVIIEDAYPKALRHYLVLPRSPTLTLLHPLEAFRLHPEAYLVVEAGVEKAKDMVVDLVVKAGYIDDDAVARATFRNNYIRAGVHAEPSLANLHVHVITQDFCLARLKNKKHYNSFTTAFFVDFSVLATLTPTPVQSSSDDDFVPTPGKLVIQSLKPLKRAAPKYSRSGAMTCVHCGRKFNAIPPLKAHLREEFESRYSVAPPL